MLIVMPREEGHFKSYFEFIQYASTTCTSYVIVKQKKCLFSLKSFLKLLESTKGHREVLFLHGEIQFLLAILLRLFKPRKKVKIIFYYGLIDQQSLFKKYFSNALILTLKTLNVLMFQLELDPTLFTHCSRRGEAG